MTDVTVRFFIYIYISPYIRLYIQIYPNQPNPKPNAPPVWDLHEAFRTGRTLQVTRVTQKIACHVLMRAFRFWMSVVSCLYIISSIFFRQAFGPTSVLFWYPFSTMKNTTAAFDNQRAWAAQIPWPTRTGTLGQAWPFKSVICLLQGFPPRETQPKKVHWGSHTVTSAGDMVGLLKQHYWNTSPAAQARHTLQGPASPRRSSHLSHPRLDDWKEWTWVRVYNWHVQCRLHLRGGHGISH